MFAVDAKDLTKTFRSGWLGRRRKEALRGASLQVPSGAIFGLLGPNGAGKTTLLSILATLLLPDSGTATILGHDVVREAGAIRRRLNMASGNASFVWSLRPPEVLIFYGGLYGLWGRRLRMKVDQLIVQCELGPYAKTEYNALSTGIKQRLAMAKALLNDPEVLFLDEPTLGLDPDVSIRLRAQIAALRRERGTTIILTTHYMREAEELCDQIAFIKDGRILAQGTADELKRQIRIGDVIALRLDPFLALDAKMTAFILVGTVALSTVQVCQLDVAYAVLFDIWSKSMKHQFLTPIGIRHLAIGSWIVGVARGVTVFLLMAMIGTWAFRFDFVGAGPGSLALFLIGCFLCSLIIGLLVCSLVLLFGTRAETSAWAAVNFVVMLSGIYYPISVLPGWAQGVAAGIPLTYFLDAFRQGYGFEPHFAHAWLKCFALTGRHLVLAHRCLASAITRSRRTGLLLKLSE